MTHSVSSLSVLFRAAWISLTVHSDLEAVGLTAAFSTALGQAGVSCNVVAGAFTTTSSFPWRRLNWRW